MMIGMSTSIVQPRFGGGGGGGGGGTIAAPFTRVNGNADDFTTVASAGSLQGWTVDSATPIADDTEFTIDRDGYTSAATTTTYLDTFFVTREVRTPAPNESNTPSTSTFAVSDFIYATDRPSGSGITNNSAVVSPKPIANWITFGRGLIGDYIGGTDWPVEIIAGHRNARDKREVACVKFIISDGTTTINVIVSATSISPNAYDQTEVECFSLPQTDISTLTDGLVTLNAEVYPWIGGAASVRSTADFSSSHEFTTKYFRKNPSLLAAPPVAYVNKTTGVNATGVVSTNPATAAANPFLDFNEAVNKADTTFGGGANGIDGLIVYLEDGTHIAYSFGASRRQKISRITVTRSPTSTDRASVIVSTGTVSFAPNLTGSLVAPVPNGCIHFKDVTISRSGAGQAMVAGGMEVQLEGVAYDRTTLTNSLLVSSQAILFINGFDTLTAGNHGFSVQTNPRYALIRGWNGDAATSFERLCIVGCNMDLPGQLDTATGFQPKNCIVAFNKFRRVNNSSFWRTQGGTMDGALSLGNLYEYASATGGHSFSMSNDGATYGNTHVVSHHNTFAGWSINGRENLLYDEGATARLSTLHSFIGNIHVAVFTKGDRFRYVNEADTAAGGTRLGNWAFLYGVGCRFEYAQFRCNGPLVTNNEAQVYPGLGTVIGTTWNDTSQTTRLDPLFVDNQGAKSIFEATGSGSATTVQAGAGNGDYTLQSGSPAKNKVTAPIRSFTTDGAAVGSTDNMGAFSAL